MQQPKNVIYDDYKSEDDFPTWLAGYREKIRNAYGYDQAQEEEVKAEVVRSISGRLKPGAPLNAYYRISAAVGDNYDDLVKRLTEEFLDPREKRRFLANVGYNKRKKGQSLKSFMEEIIKDQDRYLGMPDTITVNNQTVPNPEKEKDGVRRFKRGMRDAQGKKDPDQRKHLNSQLLKDADLTWKNALEVADRWEGADESQSSEDSESSDDDGAEEAKVKVKRKGAIASVESEEDTAAMIAELAENVEANTRAIEEIKGEFERMNTDFTSWREEVNGVLNEILHTLHGDGSHWQAYHYAQLGHK